VKLPGGLVAASTRILLVSSTGIHAFLLLSVSVPGVKGSVVGAAGEAGENSGEVSRLLPSLLEGGSNSESKKTGGASEKILHTCKVNRLITYILYIHTSLISL
jgi:hypothetical protein